MAKSRRTAKKQKPKKISHFLIFAFCFLCVLGVGYGIYFFAISKSHKKNDDIGMNKGKKTNDIFNVGKKTGFISNNWSLISNINVLNNGKFRLDINKVIEDFKIKDDLWLARNSISDHSFVGIDFSDDKTTNIRIGHINSLNFNMLNNNDVKLLSKWSYNEQFIFSKSLVHAYLLASIIDYFNFDVIGLTEINSNVSNAFAKNFVNLLNDLSENKKYDFILSNTLTGKTVTGKGQSEKVCIIYDKDKLQLETLANINNPIQYVNPLYELENDEWKITDSSVTGDLDLKKYYDFVRPPYGAFFEVKKSGLKFVSIFSHNDSPGASSEEREYLYKTQGSKEIFEAYQINNVLNWFETQSDKTHAIYMGDTNIKLSNENFSFKSIDTSKYDFAFDDTKYFSSSLTSTNIGTNVYDEVININKTISNKNDLKDNAKDIEKQILRLQANPYDKVIYNKNLNVNKFVFENNISTFNVDGFDENYLDWYFITFISKDNPIIVQKRWFYW